MWGLAVGLKPSSILVTGMHISNVGALYGPIRKVGIFRFVVGEIQDILWGSQEFFGSRDCLIMALEHELNGVKKGPHVCECSFQVCALSTCKRLLALCRAFLGIPNILIIRNRPLGKFGIRGFMEGVLKNLIG